MTIAQISGGIIKVLEVINSKFCNLARILESLIIKVSLMQGYPQVKEGLYCMKVCVCYYIQREACKYESVCVCVCRWVRVYCVCVCVHATLGEQ